MAPCRLSDPSQQHHQSLDSVQLQKRHSLRWSTQQVPSLQPLHQHRIQVSEMKDTLTVTTTRCFKHIPKHLHTHHCINHSLLSSFKKGKWLVILTCTDCKPVHSWQPLRTASAPLYCSEELHLFPATSLMVPQPQNVTKAPSLLKSLAKKHRPIRVKLDSKIIIILQTKIYYFRV